MKLTRLEINRLVSLLVKTRNDEINCDECLAHVSEFAEARLAGKTVPEGLESVEHHLSVCGECHEEYEILKQALENIKE